MLKTIKDMNLKNKKVFLRVDFNVPIENGNILDDSRIVASLPTINYALSSGAKVILCSHLGRPKGQKKPEFSLFPVYEYLKNQGLPIKFLEEIAEESLKKAISELKEGEILLLENIRFYPEETKNDPEFARMLASFCDVYINDAFSVAHRAHASVVGIPAYVKEKGIGFQMEKEIRYLSKVVSKPDRPFFLVVGGAKVSTKIGVLKNLLKKLDKLIIGGAMANTFLAALNKSVGSSFIEKESIEIAKEIIKEAKEEGVKIYLPIDVVVESGDGTIKEIFLSQIAEGDKIFDIGSATVEYYKQALVGANTLVWNGPLGFFEKEPFYKGTFKLAAFMASLNGVTVAGGGDTLSAIKQVGVETAFSYVSTAGGAFLEYLEGKDLPGIKALEA